MESYTIISFSRISKNESYEKLKQQREKLNKFINYLESVNSSQKLSAILRNKIFNSINPILIVTDLDRLTKKFKNMKFIFKYVKKIYLYDSHIMLDLNNKTDINYIRDYFIMKKNEK